MRHASASLFLSLLSLGSAASAQGDLLLTVNSSDDLLRTVDPATGATLGSVQITSSVTISRCNGLAWDPITSRLFAILSVTGGRRLATIDPATGVATIVGPLSDNFAGIAFRVDGVLHGVTGDGANTPESLYTIDTTTAASTLVRAFGAGSDGETICFAPDLSLYHASGLGLPNTDEVFERFDTFGNVLTPLTLSGHDYDEMMAMTPWTGGMLLASDLLDDYFAITTTGHCTLLGTFDHGPVKGMAFVPSPATQPYWRAYGDGCASASGSIPMLAGSGTPSGGQTVGLHVRLASPGSFGLLALGFGNAPVPFPSPSCQVQINPVAPGSAAFFTDATGAFDMVFAIPAGLSPFDAYWQSGILGGTAFTVTNPLQMHLR